ncbi:winged helix DNA-binding protein [soil metagenome]
MSDTSGAGAGSDTAAVLYVALGRLVRSLRQETGGTPVGPGGISVMVTISRHAGGLRLRDLAAIEGISAPSLTRILKALEEMDLVARAADPTDGRAQLVDLTPEGAVLIASGLEARMSALRARLDMLDGSERAALDAVLPLLERLAQTPSAARSAE